MGEKELKGEEEDIEKEKEKEEKTENEQQTANGWEEILGKVFRKNSHYVHTENRKLITFQIQIRNVILFFNTYCTSTIYCFL
jgi:hypothetical protein